MNIRFLGAVKGVTGSSHLIQYKDKKILLDCGLFQGRDEKLNKANFEVKPEEIDNIILSHSHIDHSGRLPLLVKNGFRGNIYSTKPTMDLCSIMLLDSAHIQEMEAEWKNRKGKRAGKKVVEPLYTQNDAKECMKYFKPVLYDQIIKIDEYLTVRFKDAGHILGSSIIEMWINDNNEIVKLVYSGDLGLSEKPIIKDPEIIKEADYLIIESTYGNRFHENIDERTEEFIKIILNTTRKGGTVVIPSFAVGRTQELLYTLNKYYDSHLKEIGTKENELRKIPVYVDSPLAIKATKIFEMNSSVFDEETKNYILKGNNPFRFDNLHFVESTDASKELNLSFEPKIIISASGMCDAGRIKHHLKHNLWKEESSIVFVGYQAEGTLGRRILDGEKSVKIFGEEIAVNAQIHNVEGFSGHADKKDLLNWIGKFEEKPKKIFIVHGEKEAKEEFAEAVKEKFNIDCTIPEYNKIYDITLNSCTEEECESILTVDENKIKLLSEQVLKLKTLFDTTLNKTERLLHIDNIDLESYKDLNNKILQLENDLMNLSMLSSK